MTSNDNLAPALRHDVVITRNVIQVEHSRGCPMKRQWDEDELAEQWALAPEELALLANKAGPTRLGFAVLLKVFGRDGRFRRSRQKVAGAVIVHLAKQLGAAAEQYLQYDWTGRAIKHHRAQIRAFFRFREATIQDGEALVAWLLEIYSQLAIGDAQLA